MGRQLQAVPPRIRIISTDFVAVYPWKYPSPAQQHVRVYLCWDLSRADHAECWLNCLLPTRGFGCKRRERGGSPGDRQRRCVGLDLRFVWHLTNAIGVARRKSRTNEEFHPGKRIDLCWTQ